MKTARKPKPGDLRRPYTDFYLVPFFVHVTPLFGRCYSVILHVPIPKCPDSAFTRLIHVNVWTRSQIFNIGSTLWI